MAAACCVLAGAVHEHFSKVSAPAMEFPKLGLEVGVRLCSQGTRGSSLRLLQGRFTLDIEGKFFMENVVRAARGGGESPALEVLEISVQVAPGGAWACRGLAAAGTHLGGLSQT